MGGWLAVGAVNGPAATVVVGELAALAELAAGYAAAGVRTRDVPASVAAHCAQVEAVREEVLQALAPVAPGPAAVPMISGMTGQWLAGAELGAGYWYESMRAPVDFERAVRLLAAAGHRAFIEMSPHPVLTAAVTETLEHAGPAAGDGQPRPAAVTGTLRRDDGGPARFLASLAAAHAGGVAVDWAAVAGGGQPVELPTYAFQRQRYWLRPSPAQAGDAAGLGQSAVGHPLLGTVVELAAGEGYLLTGRMSVRSAPWLADHAVAGRVLVPGAALVEMAMAAGQVAGCGRIEELTLEAPLVLPGQDAVQVQVTVGGAGADGQRPVEVHARPEGTQDPWARHASGRLAPAAPPGQAGSEFAVWPPPGAVPVDTAGLYEQLAAAGYGYGPAFRGLRAAWRQGDELFAEAALPEEAAQEAGSFGVHPALLDAVLHAAGLAGMSGEPESPGR